MIYEVLKDGTLLYEGKCEATAWKTVHRIRKLNKVTKIIIDYCENYTADKNIIILTN